MIKYDFEIIFLKKNNLLRKALKTPFFAVLSSYLEHIFFKKKEKFT